MITIQSVNALNEYINGVMDRANHHAHNVNLIALAIAGAVIWRATDDIEVRGNNVGGMGNMLWFFVNETRYVLSYNHPRQQIELTNRTAGLLVAFFDNSSSVIDVRNVFANL